MTARGVYSWRSIKVTTIYFECGHTRVHRGSDDGPKKNGFCNLCAVGKKPVPLPDPLPQSKKQRIEDPLARALLPHEEEGRARVVAAEAAEERDLPDSG